MASKPTIAVIGANRADESLYQKAFALGAAIAAADAKLICGGLDGVMRAACEGAKSKGGQTIGIVPGYDRSSANEFVDIVIATGIGYARNVIVVASADAVIALGGKYGTLSEIAFALKRDKPVVSLGSWDLDPRVQRAETPEAAVKMLLELLT